MRRVWVLALFALPWTAAARGSVPFQGMVELKVDGRQIEGQPLTWNNQEVHFLGRSGRLWQFDPDEASDFRKTAGRFRSYSPSEFRSTLLRELGQEFEVTGTTHYLVAHRRNERDKWAQRFEDLYRSFVHYFSVRGFQPQTPPFPLVGVVCRNQGEFGRYMARQGTPISPGVMGLYSLDSNRIGLYDMGGKLDSPNWKETAAVIIHEATHQTAFNTGVHSRYAPPPVWVAEGLATMFEAPGVYDSRRYTQQSDRINRGRLDAFRRQVAPRHRPKLISSLIAGDGLFHSDPSLAYAEAWALTFYLAETQPQKWTRYLRRTAERPPFTDDSAKQRLADFVAVFGDDWSMLEARLLRFIRQLR